MISDVTTTQGATKEAAGVETEEAEAAEVAIMIKTTTNSRHLLFSSPNQMLHLSQRGVWCLE
jgi:hypothetical protein